jgi:hypothetical protein
MQPDVSEMTVFMRSSTWISPAVAQDIVAALPGSNTSSGQEQMKNPLLAGQHYFSEDEIRRFRDDPEYHLQFRKKIENTMNNSTEVFVAGSEMNEGARKMMKTEMERRIGQGHEDLKRRLIPTWPPGKSIGSISTVRDKSDNSPITLGCRRLTPGDGYLEALVKPNVKRVFGEIKEIRPTGLCTDDGLVFIFLC